MCLGFRFGVQSPLADVNQHEHLPQLPEAGVQQDGVNPCRSLCGPQAGYLHIDYQHLDCSPRCRPRNVGSTHQQFALCDPGTLVLALSLANNPLPRSWRIPNFSKRHSG